MNDKLKDSIITEEEIEQENEVEAEVVETDNAWYPSHKRTIYIEQKRPPLNAQLVNIEQILNASLAILLARKEQGELSKVDWKRLNDIVEMQLKLAKLESVTKKTSLLEDKSTEEILEMVELAKKSLESGDE